MSKDSKNIFYIIPIIWLLGFVSLLVTIYFSSIITSIFNWPNILYNYFNIFQSNDEDIKANIFITVIVIWFLLSYFVYLLFVKFLMKKSLSFQRRYLELNLKRIVAILTIMIAYLGFIPLFLTFIVIEQNVITSISNFYLLVFMGLILPYTNFILNESKISDSQSNFQEEKDEVMKYDVYKIKSLKLHFTYTAIILILLTCLVGGLSLYRQDLAISGLSNASLLLSIVLAVIAILITLWDVAGQKQNVYDMKKEIEKLNKIVRKSSNFSQELEDGLSKIEGMNKENLSLLTSLQKLMIESKTNDKPEEFYEKVEELLNYNNFINNYNTISGSRDIKIAKKEIMRYVLTNPGLNSNEILYNFKGKSPSHYLFYKDALNDLIFSKELEVDNEGKLKITF
ncbi:hypothetical protein [Psychrobacillus lasiicapitis]|uniref:Uncharacterized protein n=1 Tax=Psychrobacillus lasiicapitis TaxID=1636719 RepID=A0A544TAF5_9BACI|nr:hypothetical protein [Psychrobacillus lasiicapitis]TQR14452.1 hypothetical protein FG382_08330 [Psychrobacillus lasiicapitis]GGA31228.1 hypothetical protein GCM10011384_20890 [Psychrobacillus lasiicapitis]